MSTGRLTIRKAWRGGGDTGDISVLLTLSHLSAREVYDPQSMAAEEGRRS